MDVMKLYLFDCLIFVLCLYSYILWYLFVINKLFCIGICIWVFLKFIFYRNKYVLNNKRMFISFSIYILFLDIVYKYKIIYLYIL